MAAHGSVGRVVTAGAVGRRPTNRWTRAAGACFVTNLVRRSLIEFAPPRQLHRYALPGICKVTTSMKPLVIAILLITSVLPLCTVGQRASSAQTSAEKYIGLQIGKSLPAGLKSKDHFLISSKSGVDIPLDFGIRAVYRAKLKMLWFERATQRDARSVLRWTVLDVLALPPIRRNKILAHSICFIGPEFEPEVFGIFDYQDKQYFTHVRRAWRANRLSEKFEEVPAKNIKCENEAWGL